MTNKLFLAGLVSIFALSLPPSSARAVPMTFQGFETDAVDWDIFGGAFDAIRVASGTGTLGVTSATGGFHAEGATAAGNWGGYHFIPGASTSPPGIGVLFPAYGYTTSVDVFLDIEGNAGSTTDATKFEFSSAINKTTDGTHNRDFIFHTGFYNSTDVTGPGAGTDRFVVSVNNNSGAGQDPKNGQDPFQIATTGWYTFQHNFFNNAGTLAVEMSVLDSGGTVINSTIRPGGVGDLIPSVVGGNRYGWFSLNQFGTLAFDNATLELNPAPEAPVPEPCTLSLVGIICAAAFAVRRRRRQA